MSKSVLLAVWLFRLRLLPLWYFPTLVAMALCPRATNWAITRWIWLVRKLRVVPYLNWYDLRSALTVLLSWGQIRRVDYLPLHSIQLGHPVDRPPDLGSLRIRKLRVEARRAEFIGGLITIDILDLLMPSANPVSVVWINSGARVLGGNGRVAALQSVFTEEDGVWLEVEVLPISGIARRLWE